MPPGRAGFVRSRPRSPSRAPPVTRTCAVPTITTEPKEFTMLMQHTLAQLKALKLDGMARAFEEQSTLTASTSLSFDA